jgi:hypothetical protein
MMTRWGLTVALLALTAAGSPVEAKPGLIGCDAFAAALRVGVSDMAVDLSHAIVVSRARSDANVFDITTNADIDATLTCRGDELMRFEARISEPSKARTATDFERFQIAALRAALGWDLGKSRGMLKGMASDARDYLAASRQRGDVYIAGKTEEHVAGGVSLGVEDTDTDRIFVIVGPNG